MYVCMYVCNVVGTELKDDAVIDDLHLNILLGTNQYLGNDIHGANNQVLV